MDFFEMQYDPIKGNLTCNGRICGGLRPDGYIWVGVNKKYYAAHRVAWFLFYGEWPKGIVDHKDGVRSNNAIENLRLASRSEQHANSKCRADSASGVKGVSFRRGKWRARIKRLGKEIHIGTFPTMEEAVLAHNAEAERLFGEYAFHISRKHQFQTQ